MTLRDEFEEFAIETDLDTSHYVDNGEIGDYCDVITQVAWLSWQKCHSKQLTKIPSEQHSQSYGDIGWCRGYNQALEDTHLKMGLNQ